MDTVKAIKEIFKDSCSVKEWFIAEDANVASIDKAAGCLLDSVKNGGKIIVFGNGGSAADSQHMAAELIVRFEKERKSIPCIALTTDTSVLTATGNDYSFDDIFSRQVESLASPSDAILAISTSGMSTNVIKAVKAARDKGIKVVSMTGSGGGDLAGLSDVAIVVKSDVTARVQEVHVTIIHALCKIIEGSFCDE